MSSAAQPKVGRSYTRARRHPWVLGKLGDFRLPMGPYTPPQLIIASVGAFFLIKTATWWAPNLGPFPVVVWAVAIWAARHSRVGGRSLGPAVIDAVALAFAPRRGRIGGRAVTPVRGCWLSGGFGIEEALEDDSSSAPVQPEPVPAIEESPVRRAATTPRTGGPARPVPKRPATTAKAPTKPAPHRGRRTARQSAPPPSGPAPTALEVLLAQAASHTNQQTGTTTRGSSR